MATLSELQDALRNADRNGATEDARKLADAIMAIQAQQADIAPQQPKPQIEDPGIGQTMLISAGKTFDRIGDGMAQAVLAARGEKSALAGLKQNVQAKDELYKPLQEMRPYSTGIGEALPSMAIPGGGSASVLGNMARMGAAGAIPGALEYGSIEERGKRAAIGGAAGASMPILGAALKTAWAFGEPLYEAGRKGIVGRVLNQVAGDDSAAVLQRLKSAQQLVPGSMPTAAQVAENGGIAAMERAAAQANPTAYTSRAMEQASARLNALRGIAGDDAAMAAAKAARSAATKDAYDAATKATYTIDPTLAGLLNRPAVQQAMGRAKTLAENEGRKFSFDVSLPANAAANPNSWAGAQRVSSKQITGQGLQDLKMAMDDMLADPTSGFAGKSGDAVRNLRGQIVSWMEGANPEFKAARTKFAELSRPVNQMQVGQALLDKVAPALSDFGALGQETGAQFARAMRNADQTVKTATQFKGAKSMAEVMTPDQMATLNAVGQDLARKANAQNLGRGVGSDTFQKLSMNNIAQRSGMPRLAGGLLELPGISRATRWMYQGADDQAQGLLANALLSPQEAAALMERASKQGLLSDSPKASKALKQTLLRSGLLAAPYASPAMEP